MKTLFQIYLSSFFLAFAAIGQAQNTQTGNLPAPTPYAIASGSQDANSQVWEQTAYESGPNGEVIPHLHHYTELATGLNYKNSTTGQWTPSEEEIDILPDGSAAATNGQHQAYFPADIYNGVITLVTPDGLNLQSRPLGLSFDDGTNIVLIAALTNSIGQLISSNEVIYTNAFAGVDADLLYVYRKSGFEQDVVFRQQPPTPGQLGLNPASTRLQLLTEFFNPPAPNTSTGPVNPQDGLQDTTLGFGTMTMTHGHAFLTGTTGLQNNLHQASVYKSWQTVDGRTFLIEEVPYWRLNQEFQTLPLPSAGTISSASSILRKVSTKRLLPPMRLAERTTNSIQLAEADINRMPGVIFDYNTIDAGETNFTFQGDTTYYVTADCLLSGTTIFEGGTIIKCNYNGTIEINSGGRIVCKTSAYLPAVFTSWNDNSIGESIGGSSGSPNFEDVNVFLLYDPTNVLNLQCLRFCYGLNGVIQNQIQWGVPASFINLWNCQTYDVETAIYAYDVGLYNVLIGDSADEVSNIVYQEEAQVFAEGPNLVAENVTADSGYEFIEDDYCGGTVALTNCLVTSEPAITGDSCSTIIFTNKVVNLLSPSSPIYQVVGGGNYYLATNSPGRGVGTTNIDPALLADIAEKTTLPPTVYTDRNISSLGTLSPCAWRDTNAAPDIGYHYDPLDYVFAGCKLTTNLVVTAGTAIGWVLANDPNSVRDSITLDNGANLNFYGTVTQPCYFSRHSMVQEGGNGNWSDNSGFYPGAMCFNGSSLSGEPQLACAFTRWTADYNSNPLRDNSAYGEGSFKNCELYNAQYSTYKLQSLNFTNCLLFRTLFAFWDPNYDISFTYENCTFYNGGLLMVRNGGYSAFWQIQNASIDGTVFWWSDANNGTSDTLFDYNAYNTNNVSWQTYPSQGVSFYTNILEVISPEDIMITNYNWQTSWFGDFYLPTNSPLIEKGSTNANYLGLYHFTTQTNQIPEGTNIVTIGYHYVATDQYGNPLDSNGDGTPDYLEDANGNGIDDTNENPWDIGFLLQPQSTNVAQGQNVTFSTVVGGIGPFTYQWQLSGTNIPTATSSNYTIYVVQPSYDGYPYSIIASNSDGHVISTNAVLGVEIPFSITNPPQDQTVVQGTNVTFSVGASGNYLSYQWYSNNVALQNNSKFFGAQSNTLTISNVAVSDGQNYAVIVTNLFGSQSASATLTVVTNPVISSISPNTNAIQSEDVTFTVTDSGEQSNQWWFSNSVTNAFIAGAIETSYTQLVVQTNDDGLYYVVVSSLAGSTNDGATLNVLVPPWITSQPVSVATNRFHLVTFGITATGSTNLSYQWFMNGTNAINGATSANYSVDVNSVTNAGGYSCLVSNVAGTNMSAWAWLSVIIGSVTNNGWGGTNGGSPPAPEPAVSMLSPTNTVPTEPAIYPYGPPISIRAMAFSQYSYITNLAFYFTGTNAGPGTNFIFAGNAVPGPDGQFALAWTNALPGTNILKARAWDYSGNTNDSTNLTYVIMTVPPSFGRAPDTDLLWVENIGSTNIFLSATWTNDGQPYSYVTNINWTESSGPPGAPPVSIANSNSLNPNATFYTNGTYYLQLEVDNGYATNIQTTKVTIIRHPHVYFNTPTNGSTFVAATSLPLKVTATAYDGSILAVTNFLNGVPLGSGLESVNNSFTYLWQNPPLWTNTLSAVAYCSDGLTSTSALVNVTNYPPLAVQFVTPTNGQLFIISPTNILLSAQPVSYTTFGIASVTFSNQTQSINLGNGIPQTNGTYQLIWGDVTNGTYTITATATDLAGNVTNTTATITNNAMPIVSIVSPTNIQSFQEVTNVPIEVMATDIDGTIASVQFYTNGLVTNNLLGSLTITNAETNLYVMIWSNLPAGAYPVYAVATDNRGASTVSEPVAFKVTPTNLPPTVQITYPTNNETFPDGANFTITANATNGGAPVTNVEFYINGLDAGGDPNPPYELNECCWKPGTYQIIAIATDNLGGSAVSSNVQITVMQPTPLGQGYWDPVFAQSMTTYFDDSISNFTFTVGSSLSTAGGNSQTVYVTTGAAVFSVTDGTNWFMLPFATGTGAIPETSSEWTGAPYYALLADGTNVYAYGATNGTFTLEPEIHGDTPPSDLCQLLESSGSPITLGTSVMPLGTHLDDCVLPMPIISAITKFQGNIYVGGNFTTAGSPCDTNIAYIAELNPTNNSWEPVGNGLNGPVVAMTVFEGSLYIGGSFTNAGGNADINYVARLAGNIWTNLGAGVSVRAPYAYELTNAYNNATTNQWGFIPVQTFAVCGTNLFVGGQFTDAGGDTNAHGIAIWDGANWHSMDGGPGVNTSYYENDNGPLFYWPPVDVTTISAHGNQIYVGGNFSYVANEKTNNTVVVYSDVSDFDEPYPYDNIAEIFIVSNDDSSIVPASCIAMANWSESDQKWHWSSLDGGVEGNVGAPDMFVESSAIISSPDSNSYDLYIGTGSGAEGYEHFLWVGSEEVPVPYSMARWRVGYPLPPGQPTITITNPLNDAVFTNTDSITIAAIVSSYTNIADVEFLANGQNLGPATQVSSNLYSISWTPSFGLNLLTASATDVNGLLGNSQPVLINIINPSGTVTTTNSTYTVAMNSPPTTLNVLANDSTTTTNPLQVVAAYIVQGNVGNVQVSYNNRGVVYSPNPNAFGTDIFVYSATDGVSINSAYVTVNVIGTPGVQISTPVTGSEIETSGGVVSTNVSGYASTYGGSITNISLYVNGILYAQTNTPSFNFAWSTNNTGVDTFVAVAYDTNGLTNISSPVTIIPFASSNQVTGAINNLPQPITVFQSYPVVSNGLFDLQGQARISSGTVAYQVILCQPDGYDTPIANITPQADAGGFHEGSDNSGDLGTLNLSTFQNGVYVLELNVYGGGTVTNVYAQFILNTPLKVGQFTFSEQDLNLPVHGIPITVTRTYNSQNPNSADFGYGWTLAMNSMNVQLDEDRQEVPAYEGRQSSEDNPATDINVRSGGGWDVSLTLPNGQQTTFNFSTEANVPADGLYTAEWSAPPWIHATLVPLDQYGVANDTYAAVINTYSFPDPDWWENPGLSGSDAPFENQDLPGWLLTTLPDNTKYYITRGTPHTYTCEDPNNADGSPISATIYGPPTLTSIVEPSGDSIVIKTNSIYHVDPTGTNISSIVNITRDGQGRITSISDPDATNGLPLVQYIYDQDSGNLIQVLKLQDRDAGLYATNHYDYNNPNYPHLITSIENANGVPITENSYDNSGRLIQTVDALDRTNQFIYAATNVETMVDPLGRTNTLVYDPNGNIIAQTNPLGQVTLSAYDSFNDKTEEINFHNGLAYTNTWSYDGNGSLISSADPLGDTNGFTYNGFGEALTSVDALGHTTYYAYDGNGELISATDAVNNVVIYIHQDGLLAGATDPIGTRTTNYYDASGNLTNTATLDVSSTILSSNTYTYDANYNRLTSTIWWHVGANWTNATTTYIYDAQNRVIQTINPDSGTNTVVYDLIGQRQATIDPLGHTNLYFYDAAGRLVQTQYPDGTSETSAYDAAGNRTNSVDRLQRTNTYVYDALNHLIETIYPDGATNATIYDDLGRVAQTIDARGTITGNAYDAADRRIAVTNAIGTGVVSTNFYNYDADGNQTIFTDANGHSTTNVYDALNRQIQILYPDGTATRTLYDGAGRSIAQINQDNMTNEFGYDGAGRLISVTNAWSTPQQTITRYQYDEAGNETVQIDPLNHTNLYFFDSQGRRVLHTMPGGQSEGFAYDLDGNQIYATNFNGSVITNAYDENNRLTKVNSGISYQVQFLYSATGQRTNMVDPSGTNTYVYDMRDRLKQKSVSWKNGPSVSLNYLYDANGNVTNLWSSTSGGVTNVYQYDALNRLTNVIGQASSLSQYSYDAAGNLQAMHYGNGITNLYQYDTLNRMTNSLWKSNSLIVANFCYQLGQTGNRTNLSENLNGISRSYQWQYDNLYRLTNENIGSIGNLGYFYDPVGNRTNRTSVSISQLPSAVYIYNPNDWLTNTDTYDNNGSTITNAGNSYQYDLVNHITNAIVNGVQIGMAYDGDGNRASKTVGSTITYYLLDEHNPSGYIQVVEEWTNSALAKVYNYGLDLINQRQPGISTNYFIFDGHGSTRILTDIGGTVANSFIYDAYGTLIASNTAPETAYLYCCQQWDADLGLYLNRARYLNVGTGRFWTADSEGHENTDDPLSLHRYLYAEANPIGMCDPSGHDGTLCSISFTMGIMVQEASLEIKGADTVLTAARAMFGADENVNKIIFGLDVAQIINEKVGTVLLGAGAFMGGLQLINVIKAAVMSPESTIIADDAVVSLENLSSGWGVKAAGGDGDCVPMAAGIAESLRGRTIPINPPAWFKQTWLDPSILEEYFGATFSLAGRNEDEARSEIMKLLEKSGEGSHGIVLGVNPTSGAWHCFNVQIKSGMLNVIDVSALGTGFKDLKSIEFMPVQ